MKEGLYSILEFNTERNQGMGGYGPTIVLSELAVAEFIKVRRQDDERLTRMLQDRITRSGLGRGFQRIEYYHQSWLLVALSVDGRCACFGVEGSRLFDLERVPAALRYSSHNIDSMEQSAVLLSTWLLWFNHAITLTGLRQPFASL